MNKRISVKQLLSLNISFLFVFYPVMAADIVVDATRTHQNTSLDTAANGTSVVNISTPNTNGVSHNTYIQFNVPTQGTILNNADREVQTQLAGYIYGNENVRNGSASLILNEVSGTNRSRLNGYLEVAGQSADVIVANPNGITVNGAGFINIPKATLTTGKVSFTGNRPIFDIEGGDIFIDGKGLDGRGTSSLDLYTQAIKLNAKLYANDLRVVTGLNHIDENAKVTSRDAEEKDRPAFSIDSTALGGIYANAISLVGTQKGVGVNLPSEMLVQDRLEISADGKIVLGKVSVKNRANIRSNSSSIEINEGVHAANLDLQALTDISLHGNTAATSNITLLGNNLYNNGLLAAGVNADFTQAAQGTLDLELGQSITNEGVLYGLDAINMDTKNFTNNHDAQLITQALTLNAAQILDNAGELRSNRTTLNAQTLTNTGFIYAKDSLGITADSVNNSDGNIEGLDTVTLHITNDFVNNNGTLFTQKNLLLQSGTLEGIEGNIVSEDRADIIVSGLMNIDGGYLESNELRVHAREIQANSADLLSYDNLDIITQEMTANASSVQVVGDIDIKATNSFTQNNNALLYATGNIDLETQTFNHTDQSTVQSDGDTAILATSLNNTGSTIVANSVEITAQTVNNTDGALQGSSDVSVNTDTLNNTRGALQANGNVNITATGNVDNTEGTIYSGEGTIVTANEVNNEDGFIGSVKAVFLDLFGLSGDNGTVSGDGVTIHTVAVNANNATIQSTNSLDIVVSGDVTLSNSAILSNGELKLTAEDTTLNGSTLYSGHDNINVNSATLDAHNAYVEANQALVFNASKDIYVSGSTIKGNTVEVNTVQNMIADGTNIVAGDDLGIHADNLAHSNGQLIATNDLDVSLTGTLTQNNTAFIAYHNTDITAGNHTLSGASTLYAGNVLTLNIAQTLNHTDISRIISDNSMTINAQTLSLDNASLFAQNTGIVNTTRINNTEGTVSGTEMNINTATFNNANSNFYSDDGIVNITTTGTLNNHNGFMSANGNLMLHAQNLDNRNGDLEAGNTLDVTSNNLQIDTSRFFAGNHLALTSNISNIDAGTQFLSSNSMDLDFVENLINHGEITSNNVYGGETNIMVHGDVSNYSTVTANGSLSLSAHTLNNNTGARIRGGGDTAIILSGDLNNHHFMTSSQNLEVTAQNINNYAGIAADEILTLNSINLYNYNTLLSGIDMNLYVTNLLRNHEDATIYAGRDLTIAANIGAGKTNKVENISAKIESHRDMRITAKDISNISVAEITTTLQTINGIIDIKCDSWGSFSCPEQNIALEIDLMAIKMEIIQENADNGITLAQNQLKTLLTEEMIKRDTGAFILNMYKDTKTTSNELYFYELTASLTGNEMIVKRTKPHKKEEYRAVTYSVIKEILDAGSLANHKEGKILSGHDLTLHATTITNKTSLISASNDIHITAGTLNNIGVGTNESIDATINYHWKRNSDGGKGSLPVSKHDEHETGGVPSQILAGGAITGNIDTLQNGIQSHTSVNGSTGAGQISTATPTTNESQNTVTGTDNSVNPYEVDGQTNTIETTASYAVETLPLAVTPQIYDPSTQGITLPNNPYGIFVANPDPDGPLIESNLEYTNYNNFVSSDYMLERLGYDGSSQMRRLGDAMYETQLIRDAIIAMTGQRYIGTAQNDNDQYIHLMSAGVNYAQEVGLQLGTAPTSAQLKDLKDDLVWMEIKVVDGKQVLAPVIYLAHEYSKPTGANINVNSMDLMVDGHLGNSGTITTREDMTLRTGTMTNVRGNIESGRNLNISAIGDIQNLSGNIEGGSVVLASIQGNIVNKTLSRGVDLQYSVGKEHYTIIDETASITATKGNMKLDAAKNIENIGADLSAKRDITLKAGEDVTIKTLKELKSYDYTFSNGYAKGESVSHTQSNINAGGLLDIKAGNNVNLEAVNIKVANTRIEVENTVNLSSVVDSKYSESHFTDKGTLSKKSVTDIRLAESVKSTSIDTGIVEIKGKEGVALESARITASESVSITSAKGDVAFTAKSYTNASYYEEIKSSFGGLIASRSVDSLSETLLADSATKAESQIVVQGKNVNLRATDLTTTNGNIFLTAEDKVSINAGMESKTEQHVREKSGIGQGGHLYQMKKDETATYDETAKASNVSAHTTTTDGKTGSVIVDAGSVEVIGSNINADNHIVVATDVGSIVIKEAKEQHGNKESHEELNIDLKFDGAKVEDGKAKVTVASATYDKEELTENFTTSVSSNLQAGGSVKLTSIEDIKIQGSNIAAGSDVTLDAQGDVLITEAKDTMDSTVDETHATAEVSVSVTHSAAQAAVAVQGINDANNQVKEANRDYRQYKKELKNHEATLATLQQELQEGKPGVSQEDIDELTELITESKEDEKYYTASIAAAGANLVSKTTQAAQALAGAAASAGTAGFSASLDLDVDGTKTNTNTQSTSSTASNISATNNINISTGTGEGQQVLVQGSNLNAGNAINVDTEELNIVASKDTYRSETESEHINADASVSTAGGFSASVSGEKSHGRENQTTYTNSSLNANTINLTSTKDTNIAGANIHATERTNLNVGGDLNIASVQNRTRTSNNSVGASAGISGSTGLDNPATTQHESGASNINGSNAGANTANGTSRSKETVLTTVTGGTVNIKTTGNTDLRGALVAAGEVHEEGNFIDNEQLTLNTGTLTHSDLSNTSYSSQTSASVNTNIGIGSTPANPQDPTSTDQNDLNINSSQINVNNTQSTSKTKTLARLGEGTVIIGGGVETETDSTLNRNTDTIDKDIYSVTQQQGNVDLTVDHRLLSEDGQAEIKEDMEKVGESTQIVASTLPSASDDNVILSALGTVLDTLSYATVGIIPSEETNGGLLGNIPVLFGDNDIEHKVLQVKSQSMLTEGNKDDFIPMKESEYYNSASQEDRDALDALGNLYVSKVPVVIDANNATYQNGTNGMMNNEVQALRNMITQTHVEGDTNINGTLNYNPTHGFVGDLIESGVDKHGGTTGIAKQTGEFMYDVTDSMGASGANFANHSQGNVLTYAGVNYINSNGGFNLSSSIESIDNTKGTATVVGFGSPISYTTMDELFVENGFEFTGNFTNENDYVGEGIGGNTGHNGSATILKKLNLYNAALLFDVLPSPSPHGAYNCDPSKGQICGDRP